MIGIVWSVNLNANNYILPLKKVILKKLNHFSSKDSILTHLTMI